MARASRHVDHAQARADVGVHCPRGRPAPESHACARPQPVVHHMGHAGDRSRGDSRLRDWPDVEWRLIRENDEPSPPRYLAAYGRDVDRPEISLNYDAASRRLTLVEGSSRRDAQIERALTAVVAFLAERQTPASGREVEDAVVGPDHKRAAVRAALKKA